MKIFKPISLTATGIACYVVLALVASAADWLSAPTSEAIVENGAQGTLEAPMPDEASAETVNPTD